MFLKIINFIFFVNIKKNSNFKKGTIKEHSFELLFIKKYELPALTYFHPHMASNRLKKGITKTGHILVADIFY